MLRILKAGISKRNWLDGVKYAPSQSYLNFKTFIKVFKKYEVTLNLPAKATHSTGNSSA